MNEDNEEMVVNSEEIPLVSISELVPFKENLIRDICLLNKNFDLSSMPSNYMRKRSKIEEIIYQAVFNQNNHKSPFASFKIANDCISDLNKIDIVTGTNNLKKVIQSLYENSEQISIMVHKIGSTWLMDEFDLDALFLGHQHYADWEWLRKFIERDRLQFAKPDLSRAALTMRDLYAKFLYHSVNQRSIQLPDNTEGTCCEVENVSHLPITKAEQKSDLSANIASSRNRYDHHREDFINLVDWKLKDLSFLVGSDLTIFGTKSHPCISLRLHPCQEPINILTGIDMWLENLLNEVPEVAMCYHDQGIVMREYEIFRTDDIPQISGFDKDEVESIAKNLSHFLSTNATKEGHTYWLFKETDSTMVKLYDLTDIWMKNQHNKKKSDGNTSRHSPDGNPFILPVAVLCFEMAENRINQWHRARNKRGKANLTSSQFNKELLEKKLADDVYYFNDIFRLLKNCINLLIRTDKHQDLVNKAIILMCQLYLEVDQVTLSNLHHQQESQSTDIVRFDLNDLKSIDKVNNSPGLIAPIQNSPLFDDDSNLIGTQLYKLCLKNCREELFVKTLNILESSEIERNSFNFTNQELLLRNHLLCNTDTVTEIKEISTLVNQRTMVKENLIESVINFHEIQCLEADMTRESVDDTKLILKSGFLVVLLDDSIWSETITLSRESKFYCNLIKSFVRWHVDLKDAKNCPLEYLLDSMDSRIIKYYSDMHHVEIGNIFSLFHAIFTLESKRTCLAIEDRMHNSWYEVLLFLLRLSNQLMNLPLAKSDRVSIQRGIPILVNFLVGAIVSLYNQEMTRLNDDPDLTAMLHQWCNDFVFSNIDQIRNWTIMTDFACNIEDTLLALVWMNKAKLYRLSTAIMNNSEYLYSAIEAYTKAIDTLGHSSKKKLLPMSIGIKCDRIDLCIQLLEKAYGSLTANPENSISEMNAAVTISEKIYKTEGTFQGYEFIKNRLGSLRLRMNYVRYYLNVKTHKPLNYEQIVMDFQEDMRSIMAEKESISKCKESLLIMFYLFKIESDRLEILSAQSLESFLHENVKILYEILSTDSYRNYLVTEGETKVNEVHDILVNIVRKVFVKCQSDCLKKRKVQRNRKIVEGLEDYFHKTKEERSKFLEMKDLLQVIKEFF